MRKLLITLFLVALAAAVWATGGKESPTAAAQTAPGPFGKYDPPITVKYVLTGIDGVEFSEQNTAENNNWTRAWLEDLGIIGKLSWATTGAQFRQKWEATVASGDLPDILPLGDVDFEKFQAAGMLADLTAAYKDYASPTFKEYMGRDKGVALSTATVGGKLWYLPNPGGVGEGTSLLWLRTDWLQKLGLQPPKTMNDLIAVARAFARNDPDGNGKADTVGISINKDLFYGFGWLMSGVDLFFAAYRSYPTQWVTDSAGKLAWGGIQPEAKTALGVLQQLYKEGVVDAEFGTKDSQKVVEEATAGRMGILLNPWWAPEYPIIFNMENDPNATWRPYRMVSADNRPAKVPAGSVRPGGGLGVRKGYANPEVLVKLRNHAIRTLYESTPETFDRFQPIKFANPTVMDAPYGQMQIAKKVTQALQTGSTQGMNNEELSFYLKAKQYVDGNKSEWHNWFQFSYAAAHPDKSDGPFDVIERDYINGDGLMTDSYRGPVTATMLTKQATLDKMMKEVYTRIITGAPLSEFDTFVADWKKLGGDDITREANEWTASQPK